MLRERICTFSQNLGSFLLRDTFDLLERTTTCICDRLDSVVAAINEKLNITLGKSCYTLCCVNCFLDYIVVRFMLTSSALSGVGAPGPPGPISSSMPWEPSTSAIAATNEEQTT